MERHGETMIEYSPTGWMRDGRGHSFQFYVCDEEILEVLTTALPDAFEPYSVIGTYVETHGRRSVHRAISRSVDEFLAMRKEGIWQFFLHSLKLTPNLKMPMDYTVDQCLSLGGLVNLQQGRMLKGRWQYGATGVVNRIRNIQTNDVITHDSYERIFRAVKAAIREKLSFTTIRKSSDGVVKESKSLLMSSLFAKRCQLGTIVADSMPGLPQ